MTTAVTEDEDPMGVARVVGLPVGTELCIMRVPVISTAHLPSAEAVDNTDLLSATYEGGWFVYVEDDPIGSYWYEPIRIWAKVQDFAWVRFDSYGDVIADLEVYEW